MTVSIRNICPVSPWSAPTAERRSRDRYLPRFRSFEPDNRTFVRFFYFPNQSYRIAPANNNSTDPCENPACEPPDKRIPKHLHPLCTCTHPRPICVLSAIVTWSNGRPWHWHSHTLLVGEQLAPNDPSSFLWVDEARFHFCRGARAPVNV